MPTPWPRFWGPAPRAEELSQWGDCRPPPPAGDPAARAPAARLPRAQVQLSLMALYLLPDASFCSFLRISSILTFQGPAAGTDTAGQGRWRRRCLPQRLGGRRARPHRAPAPRLLHHGRRCRGPRQRPARRPARPQPGQVRSPARAPRDAPRPGTPARPAGGGDGGPRSAREGPRRCAAHCSATARGPLGALGGSSAHPENARVP